MCATADSQQLAQQKKARAGQINTPGPRGPSCWPYCFGQGVARQPNGRGEAAKCLLVVPAFSHAGDRTCLVRHCHGFVRGPGRVDGVLLCFSCWMFVLCSVSMKGGIEKCQVVLSPGKASNKGGEVA